MHAMLDGRQTVLLRKGGIHEKRFDPRLAALPVLPDGRAQPRQRVRPEHRDLLTPAAADSTEDADRPAGRRESRRRRRGQPARRARRHRAAAHLDRRFGARRPAGLPAEAPADSAGGCRSARWPSRSGCPALPEYAGCKSWVPLPVEPDVVDARARRRDAARHRRAGARFSGLTAVRAGGQPQPRRALAEVHGVRCGPSAAAR